MGYHDQSQPKEVLKNDKNTKTEKVAYTLVEFLTDLKIIWNFIFEWFREKNDKRQNILRKRQLWIKKCNCIMEQWKQEITKKRSTLKVKSSIPIARERNKERKGKQRQYVLKSGYDYTLEVGPKKTTNLTAADHRSYAHGGLREQGGGKSSEFRNLPTRSRIEDIPKNTSIRLQRRRKMSGSQKELAERCSLCLATGGHLAKCSGCRRIR